MSDLNEWLKERHTIHNAATEGPWVHDEYTGVEGIVYPDTAFAEAVAGCGDRDDSAAIVDAHNTLPALLTAVEKVLEVLDAGVRDGDSAELIRRVALMEIEEAIEGAINE